VFSVVGQASRLSDSAMGGKGAHRKERKLHWTGTMPVPLPNPDCSAGV